MNTLLSAALALIALGIAIRFLSPYVVPHVLYHPEPIPADRTEPAGWGFADAEEVRFEAADGVRLHGWWFPARGGRRGAAIYFHGNAGNLVSRGDVARGLARDGLDVLLFDYRGYGASEGRPGERGIHADATGAYRFLLERGAEPGEIVLVGNSLGSAVAVRLAAGSLRDAPSGPAAEPAAVAGLVLIGPLPDTVTVAQTRFFFVPPFLLSWRENRFDAASRIGRIEAPILFARGARDRVLPRGVSRELYEAAGEPKEWLDVPMAGHDGVLAHPALWRAIDRFLDRVLGERRA